MRARLHEPTLLLVTKANARSTVHRPDYLEYVGVKVIDDSGKVTGERHFVGLYTALAYRASAVDIPFLRRKIDAVIERSGLARTATTAASCGTSWRRSRATTCSRSRSTSCSRSPPAS